MDATPPRPDGENGPPRETPTRRLGARREPWPVPHLWRSLANAAGFVCLMSIFAALVASPWWWPVAVASGWITSRALRRST
jgi:fatty acid desaturase